PVVDTLDEAIARADAVAVCSPNPAHAEQVRAALLAKRHVVCEYPLAPDAEQAAALFALAAQVDRVLHVEHIELLTGPAATLRGRVRPQLIQTLEVGFQGRGSAEIAGSALALKNIARLH